MPDVTEVPPPMPQHADAPGVSGLWRLALPAYLAGLALLFLAPVPRRLTVVAGRYDDLVHFLIFLGLAVVYQYSRRASGWSAFLVGSAVAAAIEGIQALVPFRSAQWADLVSGVAGAGVGVLLAAAARRRPSGGA